MTDRGPFERDGGAVLSGGNGSAGNASPRPHEDAGLIAALVHLDEELRRHDSVWWDLSRRVDGLVREIGLTNAQLRLSNPPLAHEAQPPGGDEQPRRTTAQRERTLLLLHQFETALQTTTDRHSALVAEIEDLRRTRQALLRQLPPALGGTHPGLTDASLAATAAVNAGLCTGCGSRLSDSLLVAVREGTAAACDRCRRLLVAATVA